MQNNREPHKFNFDLDRGIRDQVIESLEASPLLILARNVGPPQSGVYALYFKEELVYIGKATRAVTKSKRTLRARLNEHAKKLGGRRNIVVNDVKCRYLTFDSEWWVIAAEFALIAAYKPKWNASGFGSKVPGRGRPGTERVSTFDQQFPVITDLNSDITAD